MTLTKSDKGGKHAGERRLGDEFFLHFAEYRLSSGKQCQQSCGFWILQISSLCMPGDHLAETQKDKLRRSIDSLPCSLPGQITRPRVLAFVCLLALFSVSGGVVMGCFVLSDFS